MTRSRRRIVPIAAAALVALLVSACASTEAPGSGGASTAPETSSAGSLAASPSGAPSSEPTSPGPSGSPRPSPSSTKELPAVDIGTVTNTSSTKKSGSGSAKLVLHRKGTSFGIVMQVDCSECKGAFVLTAPDRMDPFGRTTAPVKASYLVNIDKKQATKQTYELTASGKWKITVLSWNQLPVVTGTQSGKGSDVLYLGDRASALKVKAKPAGKGDSFAARVFTVSDQPRIFGNDEAFTETIDKVDLPGVIAITTNGTWTITPKK